MGKRIKKLPKRALKYLRPLLVEASSDWVELTWENYNEELEKAFRAGIEYCINQINIKK